MMNLLKQSIKSLRGNPGRTTLTTLGIVIGIATVILVLSAGSGFRSLIDNQLESYGTNTLFIATRVPPTTKNINQSMTGADQSRASAPVAITTLKTRDLEAVKKIANVVNGYGMVVGQKVVSFSNVEKSVLFYGATASRFEIDKGALKSGRFFTLAEDTGASQVAILGSNLADSLFGQNEPLGKLVRLGEINLEVIGVYEARGSLGNGEDDALYVPLRTAQKKILGIDHLLMAVVQIKDIDLAEATAEDIKVQIRKNHNITNPQKDDFIVQTQEQAMGTFNTIFSGLTYLLIAISAISLMVGGVGIMNIMYVVVTERTAEIGLKKAIGANNQDILREFLIEAVIVTLLGGIVGIILGSIMGLAVAVIATSAGLTWVFSVPVYAIFLALGVSGAIGIGFGVFPALSAARLNPIEALRHE